MQKTFFPQKKKSHLFALFLQEHCTGGLLLLASLKFDSERHLSCPRKIYFFDNQQPPRQTIKLLVRRLGWPFKLLNTYYFLFWQQIDHQESKLVILPEFFFDLVKSP